MAVVDDRIESLITEIDPEMDLGQWLIVIGGFITAESIGLNLLEHDIADRTSVPLEDLYAMEEGEFCLPEHQLLEVVQLLGHSDLRSFISAAHETICKR